MFGWIDLIKVLVAVAIGGAGWTVDSQATLISFVAIGIVWLIKLVGNRFDWWPEKGVLTAIVFVVAVTLQLLFAPVSLPLWPAYTGELATFAPLLIAFAAAFFQMAASVVAAAMSIYNVLLADVLGKVSLKARKLTGQSARQLAKS